jgi:hypothetical protein
MSAPRSDFHHGLLDRALKRAILTALLVSLQTGGAGARPSPPARAGGSAKRLLTGKRVQAKSETTIYWSPAAVRPRRAIVAEGSVVALAAGQEKAGPGRWRVGASSVRALWRQPKRPCGPCPR